jgi:class 3 adenylate cyclase
VAQGASRRAGQSKDRGAPRPDRKEHRRRLLGGVFECRGRRSLRCGGPARDARARVEVPDDRRIIFRIGINLGDVIVEEHDIFSDG